MGCSVVISVGVVVVVAWGVWPFNCGCLFIVGVFGHYTWGLFGDRRYLALVASALHVCQLCGSLCSGTGLGEEGECQVAGVLP